METPLPPLEDHSFAPVNSKLISVYLRRRVAGKPLSSATAAYFHNIDIYAAEPTTLTAGLRPLPARKGEGSSWLCFTPVKPKSSTDSRRSRKVGVDVGTWHSEHAPEAVIDDEGNRVGQRQLFSYEDKGGKRSGWSMWEFGSADQEGGETLLVLCKIHQAHTSSRRADGSAARSARKRKGTDDNVDKKASAPVKRRIFAPLALTLQAASEDRVDVTSEAIRISRTETEAPQDRIDATVEAIPNSRGETEASKDTLRSVMTFCEEPYLLQQDKISTTLSSISSFSPRPDASQENVISTTMECPATARFFIPELEAIPSSRTETEASMDAPRSMLSFWDKPSFLQQDKISATLRSHGSFSPKPTDASQDNTISTTIESSTSFLLPLPEASQGEMTTLNSAFLMDGGAPPAPEYCHNESFTNCGVGNVSGVPLCAPGADISGPWTGYDTIPSSCSVGNAFHGGFPTYDELGAGASGSLSGYEYDTTRRRPALTAKRSSVPCQSTASGVSLDPQVRSASAACHPLLSFHGQRLLSGAAAWPHGAVDLLHDRIEVFFSTVTTILD